MALSSAKYCEVFFFMSAGQVKRPCASFLAPVIKSIKWSREKHSADSYFSSVAVMTQPQQNAAVFKVCWGWIGRSQGQNWTTTLTSESSVGFRKKRLMHYINQEWHKSKCLNDLKWKTYVGAEQTSRTLLWCHVQYYGIKKTTLTCPQMKINMHWDIQYVGLNHWECQELEA